MTRDEIAKNFEILNRQYEIIANYDLDTKQSLGIKNRYCRFCGKSYPNVTFNNIAHAIPESLGNKSLFSHYECDNCNHYFGEVLENHLSKYMQPYRIVSQIFGKKSKIGYKSYDKTAKIEVVHGRWNVEIEGENKAVKVIDEHTLEIEFTRQPYIPLLVYKAFVKIGITVVPESELINLSNTITWLRKTTPACEDGMANIFISRFYPGLNVFPTQKITVFKRKNDEVQVPLYQMVLAFSNYCFQFIIPCYEKDKHLNGKELNLTVVPTPFDSCMPGVTGGLISLCNGETVKNETVPIRMYYEHAEFGEGSEGLVK